MLPDFTVDTTISSANLEKLTGLTDRRHRQLAKEGYFPDPVVGQYKLIATMLGYQKYLKEKADEAYDDKEQEETGLIRAQRLYAEVRLQRARKEVIPAKSVYTTWSDMVVTARQQILAMPNKIAALLGTAKDAQERLEILKKSCNEVLENLSKAPTYKWSKEAEEDPLFDEDEAVGTERDVNPEVANEHTGEDPVTGS